MKQLNKEKNDGQAEGEDEYASEGAFRSSKEL